MDDENPLKELACFVQARRERLDLNRSEVERRGGMGQSWVRHLEAGQIRGRPKVDTLAKLAKGLDVDVQVLMRLAGYPEEPAAREVIAGIYRVGGELQLGFDRQAFEALEVGDRLKFLRLACQIQEEVFRGT